MKAIDQPFPKIINGALQFVIPVFQRDYSWSEGNSRQLWEDILQVSHEPTGRGHFIGSLVYIPTGDITAGFTRWLLIDGQQRVTTLTLLLAALRDHIRQTGWTGTDDGVTVKRIDAYFLRNVHEEGDREIKLKLRRHDNATLEAIIRGTERPERPSKRIIENYELFRELLQDADPEQVYQGINRLVLVDVTLERGIDDPQMIFESLNSTGVDLSSSDLIRNFILMSLPEKEQTRLYESYWARIETLFRGNERIFDNFIRDYLALQSGTMKLERADRIYAAFRRTFGEISRDSLALEALLKNLLRRARHYAAFAVGGGTDERARAFADLRLLGDVPAILVMRLLEAHETWETLTASELLEAIRLLESYLLRRSVIGLQTRSYGTEFTRLAIRVHRDRPLASLKAALAKLSGALSFPEDEEFERALLEGDLYHKRVCFHVLEGLENRGSKELSDTSGYSIEHILPQNERLSESWRTMLGDDWRQLQKTWLHRLGNLTLTGYNSTYSDRALLEKQTIPKGFKESSVRLNHDVRDAAQWTEKEIQARGKRLVGQALKIWGSLKADPEEIRAIEQAELQAKAASRSIERVAMTDDARALFRPLRERLREAFPQALELAESKSISYHDPDFFLEVIPRKRSIVLLLPIDYHEIEKPDASVVDAADYTFVMNASHEGGVLITLSGPKDIERAMRTIGQSRQLLS